MISGTNSLGKAAELSRGYQAQGLGAAQNTVRDDFLRRFDSVTLSNENGRTQKIEMDLRGKLTQEVRTATPTAMIAALREQVASGAYQPDPMAIARKMLLMGEAV